MVDVSGEGKTLPPEPVPQTAPQRQRALWRFRFRWRKTAVGAPVYNDELLIENLTGVAWRLWHGYHFLGTVAPGDSLPVRLTKSGLLSARQDQADPGTEYLLVQLTEASCGVQIAEVAEGKRVLFELRLMEEPALSAEDSSAAEVTDSTPIEELSLTARTENALKRAGITTVGQIVNMDLQDLPSVRGLGEQSYREIWERLRGWRRKP
jgi:hypothetical protein